MDDNAPGARGIGQVVAPFPEVGPAKVGAAPRENPDLESIRLADQVTVPNDNPELVGPRAVNGARPLELGLRAADHQPVEVIAMEVDVVHLVLKLLVACGDR